MIDYERREYFVSGERWLGHHPVVEAIPEVMLHLGVSDLIVHGFALSPSLLRELAESAMRVTGVTEDGFTATPVPGAIERITTGRDAALPEYAAIVLDERFSDFLTPLAEAQPVWVIDAPANRRAAAHAGAIVHGATLQYVTLFDGDLPALLPQLQSRLGVNVFGPALDEEIEAALRRSGFGEVVAAVDGFLAGRLTI